MYRDPDKTWSQNDNPAVAQPRPAPVRRLYCSCCGAVTHGRQWSNRDTGYGLCKRCIDFVGRHYDAAEMRSLYGERGVHYDIAGCDN